jgi:GTP-binding protein HflX
VTVLLPYSRGDLVSRLHDDATILTESHTGEGTLLTARVKPDLAGELSAYAVAPAS